MKDHFCVVGPKTGGELFNEIVKSNAFGQTITEGGTGSNDLESTASKGSPSAIGFNDKGDKNAPHSGHRVKKFDSSQLLCWQPLHRHYERSRL